VQSHPPLIFPPDPTTHSENAFPVLFLHCPLLYFLKSHEASFYSYRYYNTDGVVFSFLSFLFFVITLSFFLPIVIFILFFRDHSDSDRQKVAP